MDYSKKSKSNHGVQRRLFEKRGIRKKVYKKICKILKEEMNVNENDIDALISAVQSGELQLQNAELVSEIIALGRMDKEIQRLERKLNSSESSANEPEMSF